MKPIRFSREEVAAITAKLHPYFRDELDVELRDLPAEMLIDFLARRRKLLTRNDPGRAELDAVLGGAPGVAPRG